MPPVLRHDTDNDWLELDLSEARGIEFTDALNKVRGVTGRRFDFANKLWIVEATPAKAEELISLINPTCDDELRKWVVDSKMKAEEDLLTPLPDDAKVQVPWGDRRCAWQPEKVNDEPFNGMLDYQRAAVDHLAKSLRAILADDMGLGKTLESISAVEEYRLRNPLTDGTLLDGPRLVICPASVMGGWDRELNRWLEPSTFGVQLVDGYSPEKRHKQVIQGIKDNLWTVVNWEQLQVERLKVKVQHRGGATSYRNETVMKQPLFHVPHLAWLDPTLDDLDYKVVRAARKQPQATGWLAVLADEAHRAKNRNAKRTKGLWKCYGNMMLALTGTPIMNSPDEIWALLRWLWPEQYTSFEAFEREYVDSYENPHLGGRVVTGVKNPDGFRFELKGRLVRRTIGQVRKSIPGRRRIYYPMPLLPAQRKLYDEAERDMWLRVAQEAAEGSQDAAKFIDAANTGADVSMLYRIPNGAARMVRCRQIIETPACLGGAPIGGNIDDFEAKFEDSRPEPWVVYCAFKPTTDVIATRLSQKFGLDRWTRDTRDSPRRLVAIYTGETPKDERTMIEDDFQLGRVAALVGTIDAMKEGITLTRGHLQHWVSRAFVPDVNEQGEARQADRLGQLNKTMIYIPEPPDTVSETRVAPILRRKEGIVRTVVVKDKIEEERR